MAYMNQETKAKLAPKIKAVLKKYKLKGSLSVRNHLTLCLTVKSGAIDFLGELQPAPEHARLPRWTTRTRDFGYGHLNVNPYHYQNHFTGTALKFLSEVIPAMNVGNHDNSDPMTDYFDVGWYVDVNIGKWNKPYVMER